MPLHACRGLLTLSEWSRTAHSEGGTEARHQSLKVECRLTLIQNVRGAGGGGSRGGVPGRAGGGRRTAGSARRAAGQPSWRPCSARWAPSLRHPIACYYFGEGSPEATLPSVMDPETASSQSGAALACGTWGLLAPRHAWGWIHILLQPRFRATATKHRLGSSCATVTGARQRAERGQEKQQQKKRAGKRLLSMGGEHARAASEEALPAQDEARTKRRR